MRWSWIRAVKCFTDKKAAIHVCCLLFFFGMCMAFGKTEHVSAATVVEEGTCGDHLEWRLKSDGSLFIHGTGEMTEYSPGNFAPWYSYREQITSIKVASGVTTLGYGCFYNLQNVTAVMLGGDLVRIGDYAFEDCTKIMYVTIPGSVTEIGNFAFYNCSGLGLIDIPANVTSIGEGAFASCKNMISASINAPITELKDYTFNNCKMLSAVSLPVSLESIGTAAFDSCSILAGIVLPENLRTIGTSAFAGTNLKQVEIPDSVTVIGDSAFGLCTSLSSVKLPEELRYLGASVFGFCYSLEEVKIPEGLMTVGMGTFMQCTSLKSVEFPMRVSNVGSLVFWGCTSLQEATFLNKNVCVDDNAFAGCSGLLKIYGYKNAEPEKLAQKLGCAYLAFDEKQNYELTLKQSSFTYDGTEKKPVITVAFAGTTLREGTDYAVAYLNCQNAGNASVRVVGAGRYEVTLEQSYAVERKSVANLKAALSCSEYIYDGTDKIPEVFLYEGSSVLKQGSDYAVVYQNNREVGTGYAVITGINNYTGGITAAFQIKAASQKIETVKKITKTRNSKPFQIKVTHTGNGDLTYKSSNKSVAKVSSDGRVVIKGYGAATITVTAGKTAQYKRAVQKIQLNVVPSKAKIKTSVLLQDKKWKLKWNVDHTVSGYHIYLSGDKKFMGTQNSDTLETYVTKKNAAKNGGITIGTGMLDGGKRYYVKIRAYKTVKGKKYFGEWSNVKTVKIP